jgi:hypothetical protein
VRAFSLLPRKILFVSTQVRAKKQDGSTQDLPLIKVPRQLANAFNNFQVKKYMKIY